MRAFAICFLALVSLIAAPAALAAPVVLDAVGAGQIELPLEVRNAILGVCILGGFICFVLLLPDFDGREDEDWGFGADKDGRTAVLNA